MTDFKLICINWSDSNGGIVLFTNATKKHLDGFKLMFSGCSCLDDKTVTDYFLLLGDFSKILLTTNNIFDYEFFSDIFEKMSIDGYVIL